MFFNFIDELRAAGIQASFKEHLVLLEALEKHQLEMHYHCRSGFCGACRTKLNSGQVRYTTEPLAYVRKGDILPCCCVPESDLDIEH